MFVVTEADAAAIRAAFNQGGELSAAVELRRLFPGLRSAHAQGRHGGRQPKLSPQQQAEVLAMLNAGRSAADVARLFRVHRATISRVASSHAYECGVQHRGHLTSPKLAAAICQVGPSLAWTRSQWETRFAWARTQSRNGVAMS